MNRTSPRCTPPRSPGAQGLRTALALLLLAATVAPPLSPAAATAAPQFVRQEVGEIPLGPAPDQVLAEICQECDEGCVLGITFLSPDGALFTYDYGHANLKRWDLSSGQLSAPAVLPGIRVEYGNERPAYGLAGSDGSIWLLTDTGRLVDRYKLHGLAQGDTAWTSSAWFDDDRIGKSEWGGRKVTAMGGFTLVEREPGQVVLYDGEPRGARGILLTRGGRLLPSEARVEVGPGIRLKSGKVLGFNARGSTISSGGRIENTLPLVGSAFLGADRQERLYFITPNPGPPFLLECYSIDGKLVARSDEPDRNLRRRFEGAGSMLVHPEGGVLFLSDEGDAVRILRMTPP